MSEQQRHQKLANAALNNQASWQKKLSALESDVAKIEKKLDDAHIAESKKIAKETSRKIGAIEPVINVNAPLVDGDNYGNVAVGNNVTQSQTIIESSNEFEGLKDLLRDIVDRLDDLELTDIDKCDLRESVEEALNELQSEEPEPEESTWHSPNQTYSYANRFRRDYRRGNRNRHSGPTMDNTTGTILLSVFGLIRMSIKQRIRMDMAAY